MTGTFERTYRCANSAVGFTLRWTQRGHRPAHSSRASSIGSCTTPKSQTTTSVRADTLQRLRVAYWIDVGVAEVVDQVGEQLNERTPKRRFLLMRQNVDTYSLAHVVCARAHNAHALTSHSRSPSRQRRRVSRRSGSPTEIHTIRLKSDPPEPSTMYGPRAASSVLSLFFHLQTAPRSTAVNGQGPTNAAGVEACAQALRRWIALANASMDLTHGGRVKHSYRVVRVDGTLRNIVLASPILRMILRIGCIVGHPCRDAS